MLVECGLYPRWKVRVYIEDCCFHNVLYTSSWKQINKCDAETIPISLPTNTCNKYWFTSLRFIVPILDTSLHAFRLLDVHYLWTRKDVTNIVKAIANWEASNKRCQVWKYRTSNCPRPFAAGVFGLNLAKDESGNELLVSIDFLLFQFRQMFRTRVTDDLSTITYGDDEWIVYLLIMFYFRDTYGGVDVSQVYLLSEAEHTYFTIFKRYQSIQPEKWQIRYINVVNFIGSNNFPHLLKNSDMLYQLYK